MQTLTHLILALALTPAFATETEKMAPVDAERLEQLTQTLEARSTEDDAKSDGATIILERTIAAEAAEAVSN